jgi:hypothetical protein
MLSRRMLFSWMLLILGAPAVVCADVFQLTGGGEIRGQLVNVARQPSDEYVLTTSEGLRLSLPSRQVKRFVPKSEARRNYETLLPKMPPDADGNWRMAQWCFAQGLVEERDHHLQEVLRYEADHKDARLALGFTSLDGKWIKTDEYMRGRGYVLHQGKWLTPQDVETATLQAAVEAAQREIKPNLKRWRAGLESRNVRTREASLDSIRDVKDPMAVAALGEMFDDEKIPAMRAMWVEVIGKNPSPVAADILVKAAVEDNDRDVREKARDQLEARKDRRAIGALLGHLESKDNAKVNRAAAALGRIGEPETTLPLINALVTEHKFIIQRGNGGGPGSIGASFSPTGGSGLSAGGGPKVEKHKVQNQSVLEALVNLTPGQNTNFGYDQTKWKEWYARANTPEDVDLRRAP